MVHIMLVLIVDMDTYSALTIQTIKINNAYIHVSECFSCCHWHWARGERETFHCHAFTKPEWEASFQETVCSYAVFTCTLMKEPSIWKYNQLIKTTNSSFIVCFYHNQLLCNKPFMHFHLMVQLDIHIHKNQIKFI